MCARISHSYTRLIDVFGYRLRAYGMVYNDMPGLLMRTRLRRSSSHSVCSTRDRTGHPRPICRSRLPRSTRVDLVTVVQCRDPHPILLVHPTNTTVHGDGGRERDGGERGELPRTVVALVAYQRFPRAKFVPRDPIVIFHLRRDRCHLEIEPRKRLCELRASEQAKSPGAV